MEVHVGSIDEEDDEQGIAHMIEHVVFLVSKKREKLLGTEARHACIDFHHTVFHIHFPTTTKIAFQSKSLASRVEKERLAILSELQMMNTMGYRVDCPSYKEIMFFSRPMLTLRRQQQLHQMLLRQQQASLSLIIRFISL